jgi:hypothetical protein
MRNKLGLAGALLVGLVGGHFLTGAGAPSATGQQVIPGQPVPGQVVAGGLVSGPRYTVVQTDILSALVVDNSTNTAFFYTTEPNAEPGSDLMLRGSLDLTQVGQPVLKPKKADKK